ncbi:ARM repeat superfamily protein isoform 1 [Hibiscus syriacus]|uniref:RING-type E3 ubiquitin transferase n=1 Tax=Hibiscus syriacus TaxID=106335 RepID=A0A6A2XKR3_HIBSY|nr:ARM repeat superfamily protein isoform 1 [Hibiscus syriacus]
MAMELIPIGTILAVVTNQVIKTAQAAKDIVIEKESFKVLSKHLFDIEPVLKELQLRQLNDSQAARLALEALDADVKKANNLVEKYKNRGRFYLLVKCRHIVNEVQEVTRDIGRSLAAFSIANTEILSGISDQVNRLQSEMQKVEFETSHSQLQIVDRLNQGLRDQKRDQCFANDMLEEIARAVGVPVEPSEISKELASFRREIEEAGNRKERAEVFFLEQVIELLSQADAARDYEEMKKHYFQRAQVIERYDTQKEYIPPLKPFICRISGEVMDDPVSLCTGTTCERAAIEARFDCGMKTDPETGDVLEDTSLRSNLPLRQSIDEWRELNYCLKIRASQAKLSSGVDLKVVVALNQMQELIRENSINKDWISIGGLTDSIISILGSSRNREVKKKILITLKDMVEGHARNKEKVIEQQGFDYIVPCLGRDPTISMAAVELLYELLQDRSKWNVCFCRQLSLQSSAILFLVTLLKGPESSRMSLLRALVIMDLYDSNLKVLGEEGIIPPLLSMVASGNIELKELSLSVLVKLSGCRANKELIAAGGDGVKYFVDEDGAQLELEPIITQLLALQQSTNSSNNFRKPALHALLGICRSEARLVKAAVLTANGVSLVLPLLDDPDSEVREIAVSLLFLFSQQESQGVVDYLLKPKRLEGLVGFLENDCNIDVKMAAAGLLANLPKSEVSLTTKLIELDGLPAIINLLRSGRMEAREQALSALFRFTDPANVESQRMVVKHGAYPLLVNFLKAGSVIAKARAAALIGYLSMSSPKLTVVSERTSCWCFRTSRLPVCPAHGGICTVTTSFCLLEANSLPYIVSLLHDKVEATAYEAIQTLSTLVQDGCLQRGAVVLHEAKAIEPVLDILTWGTDSLKEAALGLLEKVFGSKEMVENYGTKARYLLVGLTGGNVHDGGHLGRKVAKVLSLLERYSKSSTSIIPGLFG